MNKAQVLEYIQRSGESLLYDGPTTGAVYNERKAQLAEVLAYVEKNLAEDQTAPTKGLRDQDPMPWGKYRHMQMQNVPASYMFWLWTEKGFENNYASPVAEYIRRNLEAFEKEYPDGIWRK